MASKSLTIVITGASRGLGAGMARTYLERGHKVAACSRSPPPKDLENSADTEGRLYYQSNVDVCDPDAVKDFLENTAKNLGPDIDVWINNAGILDPIKPIRETNFADFEKNIQINLMGTFHATKAYINYSRSRAKDTGGVSSTLVNISSGAAVKGYAGWGAYCSGKGAVDRLTECALAEEQSDEKSKLCFRAYSIAPGVIDTEMQEKIRNATKSDFPMVDKFHEIKANDSFNTPPYIAIQIENLALLDGPQTLPVVQRLASEKS